VEQADVSKGQVELFSPSEVDKSCISYDPVTWSVPVEDDTRRARARHGPEQIGVAITFPPTATKISRKDVLRKTGTE